MIRPSTAAILIETATSPITGFPYVYLENNWTKCHTNRLHVLKLSHLLIIHKVWISDLNKRDFYGLFLCFLFSFSFDWEDTISDTQGRSLSVSKHLKLKFVKNTPQRIVFSTVFSVFGNVVKHGLLSLIYDFISENNWLTVTTFTVV